MLAFGFQLYLLAAWSLRLAAVFILRFKFHASRGSKSRVYSVLSSQFLVFCSRVSGSFIRDSLLNAGFWLSVVFACSLPLEACSCIYFTKFCGNCRFTIAEFNYSFTEFYNQLSNFSNSFVVFY
jgi:hypothetical protein